MRSIEQWSNLYSELDSSRQRKISFAPKPKVKAYFVKPFTHNPINNCFDEDRVPLAVDDYEPEDRELVMQNNNEGLDWDWEED